VIEAQESPRTLPIGRSSPFELPPELAVLREHEPVSRLAFPDGHVGWLVTSHELVREVMKDPRMSRAAETTRMPISSAFDAFFGKPSPPGFFQFTDPPGHTRFRRMLAGKFSMNRLKELLGSPIEQIVEGRLDAMEQAGPPADLVEMFALPVPALAICELLGVPYGNRVEFQRNIMKMNSTKSTAEQGAEAWEALTAFIHQLGRRKRSQPTNDLLSDLAAGGELTDDELAGVGVVLLAGGFETTANMLAFGTFALLTHPDQLELLRSDPSLINDTVEELLRYLNIVQWSAVRQALEDVELDGHLIKAGDSICLSLPAANRDPARYDDPDTLRLTRYRLDPTRPAAGHVSFGYGPHMCTGQHLARIEMRAAFAALFERFPKLQLAVPPEEVAMRDDRIIYGVQRLPVTW
jgi:cytochrome P450